MGRVRNTLTGLKRCLEIWDLVRFSDSVNTVMRYAQLVMGPAGSGKVRTNVVYIVSYSIPRTVSGADDFSPLTAAR